MEATDVMLRFRLVIVRAANVTVVAVPALTSEPVATVEPSENSSVAPVTRSLLFGRS